MARPKKSEEEKKDKRLTFYMTEEEETRLNSVATHLDLEKTKIVAKALTQFLATLENPPDGLKQARHEKIMQSDTEPGQGYICARGHAFWLEWDWPSPPRSCPMCGEQQIKHTWSGRILKGF